MNEVEHTPDSGVPDTRPPLPEPLRQRWQPLRIGLVELFHYDAEEFWFHDGHLLLRGNNGTGKSKVLSLTLPFLFDASLKSSRIEPDGDAGKRMAWNLLLNGRHDRRIGYAWIELGRRDDDGSLHYLTLGAGLSAHAARPSVDSWFFVADSIRIGQDFWLTNAQRSMLGRERLTEMLGQRGRVFETAGAYRRAVDERLFHLGEARYAALMDTLIQLRQPQLSKHPNEGNLSTALTEALPPLREALLGPVAEAMNQLEDYKQELADLDALEKAVAQFNRRYRVYAGIRARREAAVVRSAQTGHDHASREVNEATAAFATAQQSEARHRQQVEQIDDQLERDRAILDELRADPTLRSIDDAKAAADNDAHAAAAAANEVERSAAKLEHEHSQTTQRDATHRTAEAALTQALRRAGQHAKDSGLAEPAAPLFAIFADGTALAARDQASIVATQQALRDQVQDRGVHIDALRKQHRELEVARQIRERRQEQRDETATVAEQAAERALQAETELERQATQIVQRWQDHFCGLRILQPLDTDAALGALTEWAHTLDGDNPARLALEDARLTCTQRLAGAQAKLDQHDSTLHEERTALDAEHARLSAGEDRSPAPSAYRGADTRRDLAGAPFWQLIDFREQVDAPQRAAIEAALQASGLLDAWLTPAGRLISLHTHDAVLVPRATHAASLLQWLLPTAARSDVSGVVVARVMQGIACSAEDDGAEAWIAPDGRYRLGPLAGCWNKPAAEYIGHAARMAAREQRLRAIAVRLDEIRTALAASALQRRALADEGEHANAEWQQAPGEQLLRDAHADASRCERERRAALRALELADARLRDAETLWRERREKLLRDAHDLQLPEALDALEAVASALERYERSLLIELQTGVRDLRTAARELASQRQRETDVHADATRARINHDERRQKAADSLARYQTQLAMHGAKAEELRQRTETTRLAIERAASALKRERDALNTAIAQRAGAGQRRADAEDTFIERGAARERAIAALQAFTLTGLLTVALEQLDIPPTDTAWTIEPALKLARRIEQELVQIKADDEQWAQIQKRVAVDLNDLNTALAALGQRAQAEQQDNNLIVSIVWQNQPQRIDVVERWLGVEIAQRRQILSQSERDVLENHLQAEIAAEIQQLLQDADRHVVAINSELDKRPTSTGVKFRLRWEPLPEGSDDAPTGLEAARKRLLNTSAQAWSSDDRHVVGAMLQERILAERARADLHGGNLLEQLTRALDYRRWHRFRVERWQDGQWRKLSGPASSGERALGLTVPLFAAVASFYSQGGYRHAPRLVLLDEAFAGIDDSARAHCMALIHEFDLDFVMTSEREWGCYAELPGVAICQLQRREGIDAVHVSRWRWDGTARRHGDDPNRRFPPPL
ncbi:MAG: TIGR02680 family protein [Rhodanobacter sp.]|nr:MAG: TIGR02680 family protein [Rhodanobacter sp.]TAM38917.1 MAG: TIGR02680 family protein [Rhodanobacter sp.]TAN28643.1 MAG: TIGR02680 family protein [Rhodanobacter sp.]